MKFAPEESKKEIICCVSKKIFDLEKKNNKKNFKNVKLIIKKNLHKQKTINSFLSFLFFQKIWFLSSFSLSFFLFLSLFCCKQTKKICKLAKHQEQKTKMLFIFIFFFNFFLKKSSIVSFIFDFYFDKENKKNVFVK
jgi:hypothetical protein